jgi:protein gp37
MNGTKIEWSDNTFNPWWGCVKVSPACDNCYAERFAGRKTRTEAELWGKDATRPDKQRRLCGCVAEFEYINMDSLYRARP